MEYFAKGKTLLGIAGEAMAGPDGQAKFVDGSLMRHITVMSLTASVGLMAIFAVDLVNMVFISWLKDEEITAAVGYAGAILFFTTSFGIGMSLAGSAVVARALGQRQSLGPGKRVVGAMAVVMGREGHFRRLGSYPYDQDPLRPGWTPLVPNERWADPADARVPEVPL